VVIIDYKAQAASGDPRINSKCQNHYKGANGGPFSFSLVGAWEFEPQILQCQFLTSIQSIFALNSASKALT
jgi:hypothetical protein